MAFFASRIKIIVTSSLGLLVTSQLAMLLMVAKDSSSNNNNQPHNNIRIKKSSVKRRANEFISADPYVNSRCGLQSLFQHDPLPPSLRDTIVSKIKKLSIVISHCDHELDWTFDFFKSGIQTLTLDTIKIWVFSKCGVDVHGPPLGAEIINLPNVGRCDHTYAHWMNHYAYTTTPLLSLPSDEAGGDGDEEEIIVFLKDSDMRYAWGDRTFGDLLSLALVNGFSCMKMTYTPSILHQSDILRGFEFKGEHVRRHDSNIETTTAEIASFQTTAYKNLGEWVEKLDLPLQNNITTNSRSSIVPVCYGGTFAARKSQILRKPKKTWEAMENSLTRGDNIVEGHYSERIWGSLLSKPLSSDTASAIWEMNPSLMDSGSPEFTGMLLL